MRCPRCGNENPETNRFCGMCGTTLRPAPVAVPVQSAGSVSTQVPASPPIPTKSSVPPAAPTQNVTAPRGAAPKTADRPTSISGPSFLGLNDPPPQKRASLSISPQNLDPHSSSSSSNLDYLLDDEEPPKSGAWKIVLIVVVLAVGGTLGYMRWKNQSFGWLGAGPNKPAATAKPSDTADSNTPDSSAGSAAAPSSTPPSSPADATPAPANPAGNPAPDKSAPVESPVANVPAPDSAAPSHPPVTPRAPKKKKAELADPNLSPPVVATRRTPAPAPPARDSITEAQKYIYGKGVQQDCDRGLRLLKPAADHANPKAMIEMGALYSAGLCTPRDLPTAYRWFAMALRKDPNNQSVQTDLQKLWGEMTQPERQLAIKLSQ